ncbi:conserved hypothetical protein [Streptomyces sp. SPB78]|nr:conserved hypothetical protein [Streptomyces sp. SPB78]
MTSPPAGGVPAAPERATRSGAAALTTPRTREVPCASKL